jgi:hypothetical protein
MGLTAVLGGLQGVAGIVGALGASARAKAAAQARERLISEIGANLQQHFQAVQEGNLQALRRTTGLLGDSIRAQGSDMGAALANAGVSNSSATAGALVNQSAAGGATLGRLAAQNLQSEEALNAEREDRLNNLKLGIANQDLNEAKAGASSMWGGVGNLATALNNVMQPKPKVAVGTNNPLGLNVGITNGPMTGDMTQSNAQTLAMNAGAGVGSPNVNGLTASSPLMNGTRGKTMFTPSSISYGGYRRLF